MASPTRNPVVIATDLSEHSEPALIRGRAHAEAVGAPYVVLHVIPDVLRHHPLVPNVDENDAVLSVELEKKAAELVTQQVGRVLRASADEYRVLVAVGSADEEIVRVAEEERASLVAVGASPRHGTERVLGHVAERVVRYGHTSALIARPGSHTRKVVVATDFTEGSMPAVRFAAMLVAQVGVEVMLLHVMAPSRASSLTPVLSALGSPWMPPPRAVLDQLHDLGKSTLEGLAKQYGFKRLEQVDGDPADAIVAHAESFDAEMIVMGSRGRTGLRRLVLGSTAEKVIRTSARSVLIAREG